MAHKNTTYISLSALATAVSVRAHVSRKVYLLLEGNVAEVALEWSFAGVDAEVCHQVALLHEGFAADVALVRALACVYSLVVLHVGSIFGCVRTHEALPHSTSRVHV